MNAKSTCRWPSPSASRSTSRTPRRPCRARWRRRRTRSSPVRQCSSSSPRRETKRSPPRRSARVPVSCAGEPISSRGRMDRPICHTTNSAVIPSACDLRRDAGSTGVVVRTWPLTGRARIARWMRNRTIAGLGLVILGTLAYRHFGAENPPAARSRLRPCRPRVARPRLPRPEKSRRPAATRAQSRRCSPTTKLATRARCWKAAEISCERVAARAERARDTPMVRTRSSTTSARSARARARLAERRGRSYDAPRSSSPRRRATRPRSPVIEATAASTASPACAPAERLPGDVATRASPASRTRSSCASASSGGRDDRRPRRSTYALASRGSYWRGHRGQPGVAPTIDVRTSTIRRASPIDRNWRRSTASVAGRNVRGSARLARPAPAGRQPRRCRSPG